MALKHQKINQSIKHDELIVLISIKYDELIVLMSIKYDERIVLDDISYLFFERKLFTYACIFIRSYVK